MAEYLVSIIMPVYNVEKYISKAIESILDQTYPHFELLIVDDGSPDNSAALANKYALGDDRIRILTKSNGGLSDARNYGIEHSNGRYVFFIDSDDWVEPDFLQNAVEEIVQSDSKVVLFGYHLDGYDLNENLLNSVKINRQKQTFEKKANNLKIDSNLLGILGYAWNKLYDLEYIKAQNFKFQKGVSLVEDILFNAPFYAALDKIVVSEKAYYHYNNRQVPTLIKKFHLNSFELYLLKTSALQNFLRAWQVKESKEILAFSLIDGIRYCIDNMMRFNSNLTRKEKLEYINSLMVHEKTVQYIPYYQYSSFSGKLYKYFIEKQLSSFLYLFLTIKKTIDGN